jgi:hypothetical protein
MVVTAQELSSGANAARIKYWHPGSSRSGRAAGPFVARAFACLRIVSVSLSLLIQNINLVARAGDYCKESGLVSDVKSQPSALHTKHLSCLQISELQARHISSVYHYFLFSTVYYHRVRFFLATYWPLGKIGC